MILRILLYVIITISNVFAADMNQPVPFSVALSASPNYLVTLTLNSGWGLYGRDIYYRIIEPNFTNFIMWDTVSGHQISLIEATKNYYNQVVNSSQYPISILPSLKRSNYFANLPVEYRLFYDNDIKSLQSPNISQRPSQIVNFRLGNTESQLNALQHYSRDQWYLLYNWMNYGFKFQDSGGSIFMLALISASILGILCLYMQVAHLTRSRNQLKQMLQNNDDESKKQFEKMQTKTIHLHHHHHVHENKGGSSDSVAPLPLDKNPNYLPAEVYRASGKSRGGRFVDLANSNASYMSADSVRNVHSDSHLSLQDSFSSSTMNIAARSSSLRSKKYESSGQIKIERLSGFSESVLQAVAAKTNYSSTSFILSAYANSPSETNDSQMSLGSDSENSSIDLSDSGSLKATNNEKSRISFSDSLSSSVSAHEAYAALNTGTKSNYPNVPVAKTENIYLHNLDDSTGSRSKLAKNELLSRDLSELASLTSARQSYASSRVTHQRFGSQISVVTSRPTRSKNTLSRGDSTGTFSLRRSTSNKSFGSRSSSLRYPKSSLSYVSQLHKMNKTPPLPEIVRLSRSNRLPPSIPPRPPIGSSKLRESSVKIDSSSLRKIPLSMTSIDSNRAISRLESPTKFIQPLPQQNIR